MLNTIDNLQDVIDSRDIIERISELECLFSEWKGEDDTKTVNQWAETGEEEAIEFKILLDLAEYGKNLSSDWEYGEALIRYDYFEQYMDELVADCYTLPKDLPYWMTIVYDYEALKQDYSEIDFDGVTYYIRSV